MVDGREGRIVSRKVIQRVCQRKREGTRQREDRRETRREGPGPDFRLQIGDCRRQSEEGRARNAERRTGKNRHGAKDTKNTVHRIPNTGAGWTNRHGAKTAKRRQPPMDRRGVRNEDRGVRGLHVSIRMNPPNPGRNLQQMRVCARRSLKAASPVV